MARTNKSRDAALTKLQRHCDTWNAINPVGTTVLVKLEGRDEPELTTTRTVAQILSGHSAVISLNGVSGCYLLDRVHNAERLEDRAQISADLKREFAPYSIT